MTVDTLKSPRRCESPKTSTITRMATLPSTIPATVDIFEFRTSSESRKTSTVTRMATVTRTPAIPVTVDTFRIKEGKNDDTYKETRGRGRAKPWRKKVEPNFGKKNLHPLNPKPYMPSFILFSVHRPQASEVSMQLWVIKF